MSVIANTPAGMLVANPGCTPNPVDERNAKLIAVMQLLAMSVDGHAPLLDGVVQTVSSARHFYAEPGSMLDAVKGLARDLGMEIEVVQLSQGSEVPQ